MTPAGPAPALRWRAAVLPLLLLALYAPALGFDFLDLDDGSYLTRNPYAARGLTWDSLRWALTSTYFGWWHPLTWASHLLDVSLFGWNASGHHATSVLLHAAAALTATLLFSRLGLGPGQATTAAALVFLHPTRVESVAWLSERKDLLFVLFGLLAVWAWVRYRERPSAGRYGALLAAFAASLASKATLVTLPLLLVVLESWRARGRPLAWRRLGLELLPLLSLSLAAGLAVIATQREQGALPDLAELSLADRLARAPNALVHYLSTSLWPVDLCAYYPATAFGPLRTALAGGLCLGLGAALFLLRRRVPHLAHGAAWFAISLLPVLGPLQAGGAFAADRYLYWPQLGLFAGAVLSVPRAVAQRATARLVASLLALGLAALTAFQLPAWRDSETLFRATLEVQPRNPFIQTSLGLFLLKEGRAEDALAPLAAAAPSYPYGQSVQGLALIETGNLAAAARALTAAAARSPSDRGLLGNVAMGFTRLAALELEAGRPEAAARLADEALRHQPRHAGAQQLKARAQAARP